MAIHDVVFPEGIAWGMRAIPTFSTTVHTTTSGHEFLNQNWQFPLRRYECKHGVKTRAQMEELRSFFMARAGRRHAFLFRDWTDYKAENQYLGTGDGTQTDFNLQKYYVDPDDTLFLRRIRRPIPGTVTVTVDDVEAGVTVDHSTGVVSFATAPALDAIVRATFEFYVPCRFTSDEMQTVMEHFNYLDWDGVEIREVRE